MADDNGTGAEPAPGRADTGRADTGRLDTGRADTGRADTGRADTGRLDTGRLDTGTAYSARVNNFWQGGKDNFAADREAARRAIEAFPGLPVAVRAGQALRARIVRYLVTEAGIRQFLDLGTGLPSGDTLQQLADSLAPGCRVFSVDNDPMVLTHARALSSRRDDSCGYLQADVRDPGAILAAAPPTLDLSQPVAVLLLSVLHLIPDSDDPYRIVRQLMAATAAGSHLVIVHPSSDLRPEASAGMTASLNRLVAQKRSYRDQAGVSRFFEGLELVSPGVVPVPQWRPASESEAQAPTMAWCGVARKLS